MENVVCFGCGTMLPFALTSLESKNTNVVALIDSHPDKVTQCFGYDVLSPSELTSLHFDYIVITSGQYQQIYNELICLGIAKHKIRISDFLLSLSFA